MNGNIINIIIFKTGARPPDEMWYIQQVLAAVGSPVDKLSGTHIDIDYVNPDHLDNAYIISYVMASGHNVDKCTSTPFNDRDGGSGIVIKVFNEM